MRTTRRRCGRARRALGSRARSQRRSSGVGSHRHFVCLGLLGAALITACAGPTQPYAVDAHGRPAVIDDRMTITWPVGVPSGLINGVETCGDRAYLHVTRQQVIGIRVVDLAAGRVVGQIGRGGEGPGELRQPISLLADCARGRLFVGEAPAGITVYRLSDGEYLREYPLPRRTLTFGFSTLTPMFLSPDGARLFAGGLWASRERWQDFSWRPQDEVLAGMQSGLALSLADGAAAPLFSSPIEPACIGLHNDCRIVAIARVDGAPDPWIVAQATATSLGVYDDDGALVRTIDVRSPSFLRDGSRARRMSRDGGGFATMVDWGLTNSTIRNVYAFGDVIATVHRHHAVEYNQQGHLQFNVFMNLHSHDGDGLVSDIRLPGLPLGRDDTHLLFIDWGQAGRRNAFDEVDLVRVPVLAGEAGFVRGE